MLPGMYYPDVFSALGKKHENIAAKGYVRTDYKNTLKYESALVALRFFQRSEAGPNILPPGIVSFNKWYFPLWLSWGNEVFLQDILEAK